MLYLFSATGSARLARFASQDLLVAFDFDGTLAPLTDQPPNAWMRGGTFVLLSQLAGRFPCAVVSGRSRADVTPRLPGVAVRWVVGNHGLEWPGESHPAHRAQVALWRQQLTTALAGVPGVAVEDKGLSLAVHYRHSPQPAKALHAIERAAQGLAGCRLERGILVVNCLVANGADKGAALRRLLEESGCERALFVGDDVTDEAAFRLDKRRVLSVRVGRSKTSAAGLYLTDQAEVDTLLRFLIRARSLEARR